MRELNNEEIEKLGLDPELPRNYMWHLQTVAKAQRQLNLKEFVEWLEMFNADLIRGDKIKKPFAITITDKDIQTLKQLAEG